MISAGQCAETKVENVEPVVKMRKKISVFKRENWFDVQILPFFDDVIMTSYDYRNNWISWQR